MASASGTTQLQQGGMTRMLIIRSIKFLTPLFTFKDALGAKKAIKVLHQGPSGKHQHYESRVLNLHKHPKPRVMLLTVKDAGLVCEFEILRVKPSLFPRLLSYKVYLL